MTTSRTLNHIVPGSTPVGHLVQAKRNFAGELIIVEDLMQIGIGTAGCGTSGRPEFDAYMPVPKRRK